MHNKLYYKVQHNKSKCSYGIILLSQDLQKVCVIQQKESNGYLTCLCDNSNFDISATLETITKDEKDKLLTWPWNNLWNDIQDRSNELEFKCQSRFEWLNIRNIVQSMDARGHQWKSDQKWSLPKGRLEPRDNENKVRCAQRELMKDTNIPHSDYHLHLDIGTFCNILQECEYMIATMKYENLAPSVAWLPIDQCQDKLDPSTVALITEAIHKLKHN